MKIFRNVMVVSLACMLGVSVFAVGCGGDGDKREPVVYSETFTGAVSEQTYTSIDDTVKGFLEEEINGKATEAVFVGYEEKEELTVAEATQELELSATDTEDLKSVRRIEVEYEEKDLKAQPAAAPMAETEATPRKVKRIVFVFVYENGYLKYFVPVVREGETLVASYFDSVFIPENYSNYTTTMEGSVTVVMDMSGMAGMPGTSDASYRTTSDIDGICMRAEDVLYSKGTGYGNDAEKLFVDEEYILETSGGLRFAGKINDKWEDIGLDVLAQFDTLDEYMLWNFDLNFGGGDHTCFEKTATGYKLKDGMGWVWYKSLIDKMYSQINIGMDTSGMSDMLAQYITKFDMEYEMYISNGRVSKCYIMMDMQINVEGMVMNMSEEMTGEYYNFGKTKVDVPKEVMALFH